MVGSTHYALYDVHYKLHTLYDPQLHSAQRTAQYTSHGMKYTTNCINYTVFNYTVHSARHRLLNNGQQGTGSEGMLSHESTAHNLHLQTNEWTTRWNTNAVLCCRSYTGCRRMDDLLADVELANVRTAAVCTQVAHE